MRKLAFGILLIALSSCSAVAASNPFVGSWSCSEVQSSAAGVAEPASVAIMSLSAPGTDQFTAVAQIGVSPSCSLHFTGGGATAVLDNGQSCALGSGTTLSFTMGTATVSGNALTATLKFDLATQDAAGAPVTGSGTQLFTCNRNVAASGGGGW